MKIIKAISEMSFIQERHDHSFSSPHSFNKNKRRLLHYKSIFRFIIYNEARFNKMGKLDL